MAENIESTKGGKRSVGLELNLVPFIDLMSVLITFLLITAVWSQVSMIQIGSSLYGKRSEDQAPPKPPKDIDIPLRVDINAQGYIVVLGNKSTKVPLVNREYDDDSLAQQLTRVKELYPEKYDAAVAMSDDLAYERLIRGMDVLLKSGFTAISVLTGGPK